MTAPLRYAYLHGFASSPASVKGTALAERFARLGVTLEQPDLNQPSFSALTYSGALAALDAMDDAPSARWCLIGSSMGGYLAARWAELNPDRVHRLVLLCPGFEMTSRWPGIIGESAFARWERRGSLPLPGPGGRIVTVGWGLVEDARAHPALPEVPCPTLILHGQRDEVVPFEISERYAAARSGVRLIRLDDDHGMVGSLSRIYRESADFFGLLCGG
ncbi:MAG: alpha/beta fold hydrolase [Alphaproteobacteria bacterium]|nr:alpha/beta fold hydrolase [Alphaproteobacteria bacterium]